MPIDTDPTGTAVAASGVATGVFADVIGQPAAISACRAAVAASRNPTGGGALAMTHAWLFVGPPGSGRSVIARAFAAALQCDDGGCGECTSCRTVVAGTHADVRAVVPEGLSISVAEIRAIVARAASRPQTGRWQIVLIEDADRLGEAASNALLKSIEEPPPHTVFLLCAPSTHPDDISVTIRSRCRAVRLVSPPAEAIARVLVDRDGFDADLAQWASSVCAGHVGRARALARDPAGRDARAQVLAIPGALRTFSDAFDEAGDLLAAAKADAAGQAERRDGAEREELRVALGAGGTGKGTAAATRGSAGALKELERKQKRRATRTERDTLDRVLVDLSGFYRDVIACALHAAVTPINPDVAGDVAAVASRIGAAGALARLDAILACRRALERNVKPQIAIETLMLQLRLP